MTHSDSAWTPWYVSPAGHDDEECRHASRRVSVGPTSRKRPWSISVDSCGRCGEILRSAQDLSWKQYDWVRRWNQSLRLAQRKHV